MSKIDNSEFKIFVVYHRGVDELPEIFHDRSIYQPIQAGAALEKNEKILDSLYDDEGEDNYSNLNLFINEWTAYYWIYRNINRLYPNLKAIGIFHYSKYLEYDIDAIKKFVLEQKRFFMFAPVSIKFTTPFDFGLGNIYFDENKEDENYKELIGYILHQKFLMGFLMEFLKDHEIYRKDYIDFMLNCHMNVQANMFITDIQTFNQYGKFISDILDTEKKMIHDHYHDGFFEFSENFWNKPYIRAINKRLYGFITEALTAFFVRMLIQNNHDKIQFLGAKKVVMDKVVSKVHEKNIKERGLV